MNNPSIILEFIDHTKRLVDFVDIVLKGKISQIQREEYELIKQFLIESIRQAQQLLEDN